MPAFFIIIIIGAGFALLAAISAFLIAYNEYSHHFTDKKRAMKISLETSLVIFLVFIAITVVTVFTLSGR